MASALGQEEGHKGKIFSKAGNRAQISSQNKEQVKQGQEVKSTLAMDLEFSKRRPPVPGEAVEYIYIPARGFMKGTLIKEGQVLRVITLKGKQCADTIIWDAENLDNVLNCAMTMVLNKRWNFWRPGDVLYSKKCDKLAILTEDTTDGIHAPLGAFCNEPYWCVKTGIPGCPNCQDNLVAAMADFGFSAKDLDWGSCITFFMSVLYNEDGSLDTTEPKTKPGDYFDLMAEKDIIVAISNCPGERSSSATNPTPLQAVIFNPDDNYRSKVKAFKK
jgi:uncharacterized protein YcgI (DUF1989 family)